MVMFLYNYYRVALHNQYQYSHSVVVRVVSSVNVVILVLGFKLTGAFVVVNDTASVGAMDTTQTQHQKHTKGQQREWAWCMC